jgi:hypothetical protein
MEGKQMRELDVNLADRVFIDLARLVSTFRKENPNFNNEEIVYGLLQICASMEDGPHYWLFLHEALNECIEQERG